MSNQKDCNNCCSLFLRNLLHRFCVNSHSSESGRLGQRNQRAECAGADSHGRADHVSERTSAREVPRRGGGREPCHSPKYFGQPYSSLPHRLRAEPPRRGGQGETVGADSISARKACHCRRRPRATNGRPYKTKAHPAHSCRMSCGWVGEVRTHECGSQSPVPYHLATTHYKRKGRAGTRLYGLWWGA